MVESIYGETFAPGAMLGTYIVDELAFEGGFASIYRARHAGTGEVAAIKVLRGVLAQSLKMIRRFQQEAEIVGALDHPNIVRIYELGDLADGRPYIAMEWLAGRNLLEELRVRGPLAPRDALSVLEVIGEALGAAHAAGVIHRDLKAQNVIALPRGDWFDLKLVDFGIAKLLEPVDGVALTTRTQLGTPQTAAPEQILGQTVDARTDVYGMGLLLYQLVTGRLPFDGANAIEVEEMHLHSAPPRPSAIAPVPEAVDAVVARALAKDKERRYGSAAAFVDALRAAIGRRGRISSPRTLEGMALWVEVLAGADDDATLEAADSILALAERRAEEAGLELVAATASSVLAVSTTAAADAAEQAAAALERVWRELGAGRDLRVRIAARRGALELSRDGQPIGGDLLRPGTWASGRDAVAAK